MILAPNYCWERVQKHQITLETQYHKLGTSIGTYIIENVKNSVKKDQNYRFSDLSGGVLVELLHSSVGDDISFLNAQRHLLKELSINFFIWYRANMILKIFFDNHAQTLSEASDRLVEGTIQYRGFPIEIQQKMKICKKIVLMAKK